jgi:hypothetical protein
LEPQEVRFQFKGQRYELQEPSAGAIRTWRDALLDGTQIGGDGKPVGLRVRAETDSLLVAKCLFKINGEDGLEPCTVEDVEAMPHRLQTKLLEQVRSMGDLNPLPDNLKDCDEEIKSVQDRLSELQAHRRVLNGEVTDPVKNGRAATAGSSA